MAYIYPIQLVEQIKTNWHKAGFGESADLPNDDIIEVLLETCYHASFLTEEQRGLAFRVIFCDRKKLIEGPESTSSRIISFDNLRDFSIGELMRLTPATDFKKVLIGVEEISTKAKKPKLRIWGLIETGSSWWEFIHGESSSGTPPPNYLTISSNKPGYLTISRRGGIVVSLRSGQVSYPISGVLNKGPVGKYFESSTKLLYQEVCKALETDTYSEHPHDNYPQLQYIEYIERILFHIRELNHGGVILVVPDYLEADDPRLTDRLSIKYPIKYNEGWDLLINDLVTHKKFYSLYFSLWDGEIDVTKELFQSVSTLQSTREDIISGLADSVRFVASLSGVDGAVLITDKLRILGFGCEVIAQSYSLSLARLSTTAKVTGKKFIPIQNYGTRHRSTFRFCSSFEDSVAFIVSQDGGVKAVKRVGADLVLWPDINVGAFGL